MDKVTLINNFSRSAPFYDRYANVQRQAALELSQEVKEGPFRQILEIGCGTGDYTCALRNKFRDARILALDISREMIAVAKDKLKGERIDFMLADAESADLDERFDLITSNACFQWMMDLEKVLLKYRDMLKNKGIISFSMFGPRTFWELNISLRSVFDDLSIYATSVAPLDKIECILKKHFKEVSVRESRYSESFTDLRQLLDKIKYTGVRGNVSGDKIIFSQRLLKELEKAYLHRFKQIRATYQVFFCVGKNKLSKRNVGL